MNRLLKNVSPQSRLKTHPSKSFPTNQSKANSMPTIYFLLNSTPNHLCLRSHNFSKSNIPIRLQSNPKTSALITTSTHTIMLQWLYQCFNKGRNNFATYKRKQVQQQSHQQQSTRIQSTIPK